MGKTHVWRIKKNYFNLIKKGLKPLEVRVGYFQIKKVVEGDFISFENYGKNLFKVVRVTVYKNFEDMISNENADHIVPGKSPEEVKNILKSLYPEEKEKLNVYVFELLDMNSSNNSSEPKIISASKMAKKDRIKFGSLISKAYAVTDYICDDYPRHFKWYWEKTIPAVLNGTREVLVCIIDKEVAGVAFLKKENDEAKICTFLVLERYRGRGIATRLLEESFEFLETTKPLISLADYKLDMFEKIIEKYNWELTQTLPKGYYNNSSEEFVYNGKIE